MTGARRNWSYLLTPPGAGAIGVVRVTGPDALSILARFFHAAATRSPAAVFSALFAGDRLRYGRFVVDAEVVDDVIVSQVPGMGHCAYDIAAHGGVRVIERILEALEQSGAPLNDDRESAAPVWPTGSRIDCEAVGLLSRAKTSRAVRFLARQRRHLESCLVQAATWCLDEPSRTREAVETMLARYPVARRLVNGVTAVIAGPPNAGKSTLFNRLLGRSATIVSPRAGTTRDWVTASVALDGVPVNLVDTAGRHITERFVERRAIEDGWRMAQEADLCLIVLDGSQPSPSYISDLRTAAGSVPQVLIVRNKSDLRGARESSAAAAEGAQCGDEHVAVSALTGAGIDRLTDGMLRILGFADWEDAKAAFFTPRQAETGAQILSDLRKHPNTVPTLITRELIGP